MKKLVGIILVVALLLVGVVGYARYAHIQETYARLSISGGVASCSGGASPDCSTDKTYITLSLKKSTNGSSWSTIASWSASGTGVSGAGKAATYTVSSGYWYKVTTTTTIKDKDGAVIDDGSVDSPLKSY